MMEHWRSTAARETVRALAALSPAAPSGWTNPVTRVLGDVLAHRARTAGHPHRPSSGSVLGSAVGFTLLGAAAMYLLDPDRGAERRQAMRAWLVEQWKAGCGWAESSIEERRGARLNGSRPEDGRRPASVARRGHADRQVRPGGRVCPKPVRPGSPAVSYTCPSMPPPGAPLA